MGSAVKARSKKAEARPAVQTPVLAEFSMVELRRIKPSATNPRKTFDETKIEELAASIREKGVLQPVLVRPQLKMQITPPSPGFTLWYVSSRYGHIISGPLKDEAAALAWMEAKRAYELVAGERRYRAATRAGLSEIPAIVSDLSDREALEIQVIENAQREDVPALEEADGYRLLIKTHGYTVDEISGKTGKSKSYVYGVLKLCELPAVARELMGKGELSSSVAQLIARIPNQALREEAAKEICMEHNPELRTYRGAKEYIEEEFCVELKGAPFSRKDATLVAAAGACDSCPKQSGNNRAEYPDGRADICNDTACFAEKKAAHSALLLKAATDRGYEVLDEKASRKLYPYSDSLMHGAPYVDLATQCVEDKKRRSFKQLLGDKVTPIVAQDPHGGIHYLAPKAAAMKVLGTEHGIKGAQAGVSHTRSDSDYAAKEKAKKEVCRATADSLSIKVAAATVKPDDRARMMRLMVETLAGQLPSSTETVCKRRGFAIQYEKTSYSSKVSSWRKTIAEAMRAMSDGEVDGLAAELLLTSSLLSWRQGWQSTAPREAVKLCAFFAIDFEVEKRLQEQAVKEKAATKTKTKGAAKKGAVKQ